MGSVVRSWECDQCGARRVDCYVFVGGNGEVSGTSTACHACLLDALIKLSPPPPEAELEGDDLGGRL